MARREKETAHSPQVALWRAARRARVGNVGLFALLLLIGSAAPVLAEDPVPSESSGAELATLPSAEDVSEGIALAEAEERRREKELGSPEAAQERADSRAAFAGISATEARDLLIEAFADQLAFLNSDPARFLSDAEIVNPLAPTVAVVREDGDSSLLDAGMPVRVENEAGDLQKVDLSLLGTDAGFEPTNPLTEISIPPVAAGSVEFDELGMDVSSVGADASREGQRLGDENIFYPEALGPGTDTDLLVSPIAAGVEIFNQLRSTASPETLRFRVDLPPDAELRSDGHGGAEVVRDGESLASIPFPHAVDAQGSPFPVSLEVEGQMMMMRVPHRDADVAYPLLVDPAITQDYYNYNWFNGHNHSALTNGAWQYTESHPWIESSTYCIYACWGVGRGLFVSMPGGAHWGQQYGHWSYSRPHANSYLANAWANPFVRNDHNCNRWNYPEPHDYVGMWHNGQWNRFLNDQAITYGYADIQSWGSAFIVGLATGNGSADPCWRDLALGGAAIWLDDWERPTLTASATGTWMDTNAVRLNVSATDPGLGVKSFAAIAANTSGVNQTWWTNHPCTGLYGSACPGTWNLNNASEPMLNFSPSVLPEGIRKLKVEAFDVTEKPSYTMAEMDVRIDHAAPTITLSGTVTEQAMLGTERPSYTIKAEAKDGVPESTKPEDIRSGVTGIVIENDGEVVGEYKPGCATQSCSAFDEREVPASELASGQHTLSVIATDAAGHTSQPKELTYTTGDSQAPSLDVSGLPAETPGMPWGATYQDTFGSSGSGNGQFSHPADAAVDSNGNLWVLDRWNQRVQKFSSKGEYFSQFGSYGSGNGQFNGPSAIDTDPEGNVWVTDSGNHRVQKFSSKGEYLSQFGSYGSTGGQFNGPAGIALAPDGGSVYVIDRGNHRIELFGKGGGYWGQKGSYGWADAQFDEPTGVAIGAPWGEYPFTVLVVDSGNNRVQRFSPMGVFLGKFGTYGSGEGQLDSPGSINVDTAGNVWIGDRRNGRVQGFSKDGEYLTQFGSPGSGPGQFSFVYPMGIAGDPKGSLWVTDAGNNRVQRWTIPNSTVSGYLEPISAEATDGGFGVTSLKLELTDKAFNTEVLGQAQQSCTQGACPLDLELEEVELADKPSGTYTLTMSAADAAGNVRKVRRAIYLDSMPPEIDLSGPLADSAGQPLTAAADLVIDVSDLEPASVGIEAINVERDDQLAATYPSNCTGVCHDLEVTYDYHPIEDGADRQSRPISEVNDGRMGGLEQVSCSAANDCWAVGRTKYTAAEQAEGKVPAPLLERWNGTEWRAVAVPRPAGATDVFLDAVSCKSPSFCRAAGYFEDGSGARPLLELWNGTQWSTFLPPLPSGASGAVLEGVSCHSTTLTGCWVYGRTRVTAGEQGEGKVATSFLQRWTGTAWQTVTPPKPSGATDVLLEGMSCDSTTSCRAVGYALDGSTRQPLIETWDGTQWTASTIPVLAGASGARLDGISCSSSSSCWVHGQTQLSPTEQTEGKAPTSFFERWDGSQWSIVATPKTPEAGAVSLTSLSCSSASACTAVGHYENGYEEILPLAYTWDGAEWRFQPAPVKHDAIDSSLQGVSCLAPVQCSMVGYSQTESGKTTVLAASEAPGDEPHRLTIEAVDTQGNAASRMIEVDVPPHEFNTPECTPEASSTGAKAVLTPSQAVSELEDTLPAAVAPSEETIQETTEVEIDPSYSQPQPDLEAVDSLSEGETLVAPDGGFTLAEVACVTPEQTTSAATEATVVNQDAAIFANTAPETDTVIRPTAAGTTLIQSLRGPEAPDSFSWKVEVLPGQELVELPSGAVAIVEAAAGENGEVAEMPKPEGAETPKVLKDAQLQLETGEYELASAQSETTNEVVAVIAQPWVVLSQGVVVPAKIEVAPVVNVPVVWELEVTMPQAAIEAEVWPVGLAIEFLWGGSVNGHCKPGTSPCGAPDLDRAARYAEYWGNEAHSRNQRFRDYGSEDCTNFVSQILRAGGMKFMRGFEKGDGSWWAHWFPPAHVPEFDDTESWKRADELPRHLWRFGLVHIDKNQPNAWTKGTIIAADWFGTNGKGDINHVLFVVGTRYYSGSRVPLLANHSTVNYSARPWFEVRDRIEKAEGGTGWTRFALAVKHTNANLNEKKHAPQNLYGPGGVFNG